MTILSSETDRNYASKIMSYWNF